jgi:hypothetical protein
MVLSAQQAFYSKKYEQKKGRKKKVRTASIP